MNLKYVYPGYQIDLPDGIMQECMNSVVPKLLHEGGFQVGNERFLSQLIGTCFSDSRQLHTPRALISVRVRILDHVSQPL